MCDFIDFISTITSPGGTDIEWLYTPNNGKPVAGNQVVYKVVGISKVAGALKKSVTDLLVVYRCDKGQLYTRTVDDFISRMSIKIN